MCKKYGCSERNVVYSYSDFQAMFKISFHFFCLNFSHLSPKQIKSHVIFRLNKKGIKYQYHFFYS